MRFHTFLKRLRNPLKRRPAPLALARMAAVAVAFALTLLPLGEASTSVGYMLPMMLRLFTHTGAYYVLGLFVGVLLMHRLGLWPRWRHGVSRAWSLILQSPPRSAWVLAAFVLIVTLAMGGAMYGFIPRFPDSIAHYVHGKILAGGHWYGEGQLGREFFDMMCAISFPKFISHYLPGHTILLALGWLFHAPWIINPLLGALSVLVLYHLARETHGPRIALTACLLLAMSPFFLFMSAEMMSHATSMFFALCFYWCFVRAAKYRRAQDGLLAGLSLGYVLLTRPFNAVLIGYPAAMYVIAWLILEPHNRRALLRTFVPTALGVLAFIPWILKYNAITTGDPFTFGYELTMLGKHNTIGFGPVPPSIQPWVMAAQHSFWRGILYTSNNLVGLNYFLFRWPVPALALVALPFLLRGRNAWNVTFLTFALSLLIGYILYYHQGLHFGPRYIYEATPLLILLAAAGLHRAYAYLRFFFGDRLKRADWRAFGVLAALSAFAAGFSSWLPANNIDGATVTYRGAYHLALEHKLHNALIFVSDIEYITASAANPPSDDADLIIARDFGDVKNQALIEQYPLRRVLRITDDRQIHLLKLEPFYQEPDDGLFDDDEDWITDPLPAAEPAPPTEQAPSDSSR